MLLPCVVAAAFFSFLRWCFAAVSVAGISVVVALLSLGRLKAALLWETVTRCFTPERTTDFATPKSQEYRR